MNLIKPLITLYYCTAMLYAQAYSQTGTSSNTTIDLSSYDSATREQDPIFRGAEYRYFSYETLKGIIYFGSKSITRGDAIYYNRKYTNIPLLYDQVTDELIKPDITGNALIRLFSPKVQAFRIHGSDFIYLPDSTQASTGGFWQVLSNAQAKLFKKEIKTLEDRIVDHKTSRVLKLQTKYRLTLHDKDYDIPDKNAMVNVLSDQREAIRAYLKKNRKHFRKAGFETMAIETISYYNEISVRK